MIGAVDVGGTKIAVAAVDECGKVISRTEWPTHSLSPEDAVREMANSLFQWAKKGGSALRGVGIGCTGPVDPITGIVGNVDLLPGWSGYPLVERLADVAGVSVAVENDADAAALAEARWGAGKNASRFIYVTISTGIGTGMVFDGKLYRGVNGSHPEAGHQTVDPSGPQCYCGARGCWESLASGPAMVRWLRSNAAERELPEELSARDVCDMARNGDGLALRAVEAHAGYLGLGLANLVTMFCPDVIALGGGVMRSSGLLLDRAKAIVRTRCGLVPVSRIVIVPTELGNDAPLLGAARAWQARFRESE